MGPLQEMMDRISAFPRAMQWAIWAAIGTIAFLLWDATIAEVAANWSSQADTIEMQIQEVNKPARLTSTTKNTMLKKRKIRKVIIMKMIMNTKNTENKIEFSKF